MTKSSTPPGMKRLQCIVTVAQYNRLRKEGYETNTPVTELVRQGIDLRVPPKKAKNA